VRPHGDQATAGPPVESRSSVGSGLRDGPKPNAQWAMRNARGFMASRRADRCQRRRQRCRSDQSIQSGQSPPPTPRRIGHPRAHVSQPAARRPWRHARNATCRSDRGALASPHVPGHPPSPRPSGPPRPNDAPRPRRLPRQHRPQSLPFIHAPCPMRHAPCSMHHACRLPLAACSASIGHGAPSEVPIPVETRPHPTQPTSAGRRARRQAGMAKPAHDPRTQTPLGPRTLAQCAAWPASSGRGSGVHQALSELPQLGEPLTEANRFSRSPSTGTLPCRGVCKSCRPP
jgi:hypothetical protein